MKNPYAPPTTRGSGSGTPKGSGPGTPKGLWWLDGVLAGVFLILLTPSALLSFMLLIEKVQGLGIFDPESWQRRALTMPSIIFAVSAAWLYSSRNEQQPRAGRFLLGVVGLLALLTALAGLVPAPSWGP